MKANLKWLVPFVVTVALVAFFGFARSSGNDFVTIKTSDQKYDTMWTWGFGDGNYASPAVRDEAKKVVEYIRRAVYRNENPKGWSLPPADGTTPFEFLMDVRKHWKPEDFGTTNAELQSLEFQSYRNYFLKQISTDMEGLERYEANVGFLGSPFAETAQKIREKKLSLPALFYRDNDYVDSIVREEYKFRARHTLEEVRCTILFEEHELNWRMELIEHWLDVARTLPMGIGSGFGEVASLWRRKTIKDASSIAIDNAITRYKEKYGEDRKNPGRIAGCDSGKPLPDSVLNRPRY